MWVVVFQGDFFHETAARAVFPMPDTRGPEGCCRQLGDPLTQGLLQVFRRLGGEGLNRAAQETGYAWLLAEAARCFVEAATEVPSQDLHPAVDRAAFLLRAHPETESLDAVARQVTLSPSWLSRLFHQQVGETLIHFRNRQRLEAFLRIRADHRRRLNLLESSEAAGFRSYAQFHRVYREQMGRAPREG